MSFLGGIGGGYGLFGFGQGQLDAAGNQPQSTNPVWLNQQGMSGEDRYRARADARTAQQMGAVRDARHDKMRAEGEAATAQASPLNTNFAQGLATNQSTSSVDWHEMQKDIYG